MIQAKIVVLFKHILVDKKKANLETQFLNTVFN